MISQIELRYFKCFEFLTLPIRQLTLLSGINASGKSSVFQALCILHQTIRDFEWSSRLMLNGSIVTLGTVKDIVDQVHGRGNIRVTLVNDDIEKFHWLFEGEPGQMSMELKDGFFQLNNEDKVHFDLNESLHYLSPNSLSDHALLHRLRRMTYLTAERLGPREYYKTQPYFFLKKAQMSRTIWMDFLKNDVVQGATAGVSFGLMNRINTETSSLEVGTLDVGSGSVHCPQTSLRDPRRPLRLERPLHGIPQRVLP